MTVDVVVRDKNHQPVLGLHKEEFELFEDSHPQEITTFETVRPSQVAAETPPATSPSSLRVRAPGLATNSDRAPSARIALAFEQLSPEGRQLAARAARQFVDEGLQPGDLASVVAIDRALHVLVQYTGDRALLRRGIDEVEGRAGMPLEQAGAVPGAEWGKGETVSAATKAEAPYIRAHATFAALEQVMVSLRQAEGRRVIVLFSEGLALGAPKDETPGVLTSWHDRDSWLFDNRHDHFERLVGEAGTYGLTFYTFDARGLRVASDPIGFGEPPYVGLKMLADDTGGSFVDSTNDLVPGVRRIAADLHSYYLLGYTSKKPPDGRYRAIRVKVKQHDLTVLARRGYVADRQRQ